jgi:type I restriction enzyme S subunit
VSWPLVTLGSLEGGKGNFVDGPFGSNLKSSEYTVSGVPLIQLKNIKPNKYITKDLKFVSQVKADSIGRHSYKAGDVCIAKLGAVGTACIIPYDAPDGVIVADVVRFRGDKSLIDYKYFCHYLNSADGQRRILKLSRGSTRTRTNLTDLKKVEIPLPPLNEQKRIAAILDKADAIRRKRQQAIQLADDFLRSVFLDMFGDPVTNPKGWKIGSFTDICELNPKAEKLNDELPVSFVPMAKVAENSSILDASDIRVYAEVKKGFTAFKENDVLFAKITPCMENGKAAIAKGLKNNIGFGSTEFHVFRPKNEDYAAFIYNLIHLPLFRKLAANNFSGAVGHKRVPKDYLANFKLMLPPLDLVVKFRNVFDSISCTNAKFETNKDDNEELFNSLSQKAFAGEL